MSEVGIRALKQNASAVVARAVAGEALTITDRGRPVAALVPLADSPLDVLVAGGSARPPTRELSDLPPARPGPSLSAELARMRNDERF